MKILTLAFVLCCSYASAQCLPEFTHRGDVNGSGGAPNMTDVIYLANSLQGGPPPVCLAAADVNGDGLVNEADVNDLYAYLYVGCGPCMASPRCLDCG